MKHFRTKEFEGVKAIEPIALTEAGFLAAFSTRLGGVSPLPKGDLNLGYFAKDQPENVQENRRRFFAAVEAKRSNGINYKIVTAKQVHSADNHIVNDPDQFRTNPAVCDALLTDREDTLIGIQTADCLPVLIVDTQKRAVAGIHAGWRGTLARIVEKTLEEMRKTFGTDPANCLAATGPAIGQCCFEVGIDVKEPFEKEFSYSSKLFAEHRVEGKAFLDLRQANKQQLLDSGITQNNIFILPDCTRCQMDLYFSYRGESPKGAVGRLLSVVAVV